MGKTYGFIIGLILPWLFYAQADSTASLPRIISPSSDSLRVQPASKDSLTDYERLINAPARAAFYSAVLPGLGQAYNRQYWKIPVVYALIGGAVYFYRQNQMNYLRYRQAYQQRLLGLPDDYPQYSDDVLIEAQAYYRRNRDISMMVAVGFYVLNIVDANVAAHLRQWNVNGNLSLSLVPVRTDNAWTGGLALRFRF